MHFQFYIIYDILNPVFTVNVTLLRVEPENSISATGVGLLLGGVVAGVLGVLLMIVGIVYGVWRLMRNKHR